MPTLDELFGRYTTAQFTECVLLRNNRGLDAPDHRVMAFAVLAFWDDDGPSKPHGFEYLTDKLRFITPDHKLIIADSWLTVEEAKTIATSTNSYLNPAAPPPGGPVACPGTWSGAVLVGHDEHSLHNCLPRHSYTYWVFEKWAANDALRDELGLDGFAKLCAAVRAILGVDLERHRDRVGNLLVTFPETRLHLSITAGKAWTRVGFELEQKRGDPMQWPVVVRAYRNGELIGSRLLNVSSGLHVVDFGSEHDQAFCEVMDPGTGEVILRTGGRWLRHIGVTMPMAMAKADVSFSIERPDGRQPKTPVRVDTTYGHLVETLTGGPDSPWIARPRQMDQLKPSLTRLHVFHGGDEERQRAMQFLDDFLHNRVKRYLKIWDPYFGPDDAAQWLSRVFDCSIPIRVLTSGDPTPEEDDCAKREGSSAKKWKRRNLAQVLGVIRGRRGEGLGFNDVVCRAPSPNQFHDRFLITKDTALVLGCSFNQIGQVVSTLMEVRAPELEEAFDRHWCAAGQESEL